MSQEEKPLATTHVVCGVVLQKDGKYLLVQEKHPKAYGKWNLPAGRVDKGDTFEQTAVREAKEETGFDVELNEHVLTLHSAANRPVFHAFSASIVGGELNLPEYEILDAQWFTHEEIIGMKEELRDPAFTLGAIESVT